MLSFINIFKDDNRAANGQKKAPNYRGCVSKVFNATFLG
jgi:hypothetical protein